MEPTVKIKPPRIAKSPVQGSFVFASVPVQKAEAPHAIRVVDNKHADSHTYVLKNGKVLRKDTTVKVEHNVCPRRVSVRVYGCEPRYENFRDAVNAAVANALKVEVRIPAWKSLLSGAATIFDISGTPAKYHCTLSFNNLTTPADVVKSQRDVMKKLSIQFDDAIKSVVGT
jgi:hypothetical protein